jgi:hypothetical protein
MYILQVDDDIPIFSSWFRVNLCEYMLAWHSFNSNVTKARNTDSPQKMYGGVKNETLMEFTSMYWRVWGPRNKGNEFMVTCG